MDGWTDLAIVDSVDDIGLCDIALSDHQGEPVARRIHERANAPFGNR